MCAMVHLGERATEGGVVTLKGARGGRDEEGRSSGAQCGAEVRGGRELSVHDMNEPCSVTEG